jgi:hypothetical protein
MMPFELVNRYHLDSWNGRNTSARLGRWFSSKTHWCNTPYLGPAEARVSPCGAVAGLVGLGKSAEAGEGRDGPHAAVVDDLSMAAARPTT